MSSPQLAITHIAAAQNQKEVTANAAVDALDNAENALASIANSNTDQTLTQVQLASGVCIKITGALTADRHINLPAIARSFIFKNGTTGGHNLIVQVTGAPGTTVSIPASAGLVELYSDGTNVSALTGGSGTSGLPFPTEINLAPGADGNFSVAHGLGATPRLVLIQMTSGGAIWFQSTRYDATNINLVASDPSVTGKAEVWA